MKTFLLLLTCCLVGCKKSEPPAEAGFIEPTCNLNAPTQLVVPTSSTGNDDRPAYPISDTLDGDPLTFMTTNTVSLNQTVYISYQMPSEVNLSSIAVVDNYTNNFNMGDLSVFVSDDSTNGVNGYWRLAASRSSSNNDFVSGDGTIEIDKCSVTWLKLSMKYTGTGAYGGTPAFYLSEITFTAFQ